MPASATRLLPALALAVALLAGPARATTMVPQTFDQLAARSIGVVRATVLSTRVHRNPNRVIITTARLRVTESLIGPVGAGREIEIETPGGTMDGLILTVIGAPRFSEDEDVVVFLEDGSAAPYHVTELSQGKFEVRRDAQGREVLSRDGLEGVHLALRGLPGGRVDLSQLRQRVRAARLAR